MQRVIAAPEPDRMLDADKCREVLFKVSQLPTHDEIAPRERVDNYLLEFRFVPTVVLRRIDERNLIRQDVAAPSWPQVARSIARARRRTVRQSPEMKESVRKESPGPRRRIRCQPRPLSEAVPAAGRQCAA